MRCFRAQLARYVLVIRATHELECGNEGEQNVVRDDVTKLFERMHPKTISKNVHGAWSLRARCDELLLEIGLYQAETLAFLVGKGKEGAGP